MKLTQVITEGIRMALQTIRANKLRSILSVLGITVGIYCIIAVYALVFSIEKNLKDSFSDFGVDAVFVQKWPWQDMGSSYPWWKYMQRPHVSFEESKQLRKLLPTDVAQVVNFQFKSPSMLKYQGKAVDGAFVMCVGFEYNLVQQVIIAKGRYFTKNEVSGARGVALIGSTIVEKLFENQNPIGKYIQCEGKQLQVIGIMQKQGSSMLNASTDNLMLIPNTHGMQLYNTNDDNKGAQITVKAQPNVELEALQWDIDQAMRRIRRLKPGEDSDFAINKMSMITDIIGKMFGSVKTIGLVIGLFSVLVGCFGVANIMYVSVKERTQEIGIQKSLGAQRHFVLFQFLIESIFLCLLGGIIGLFLVWISFQLGNWVLHTKMDSPINLFLSLNEIVLGLLMAIIVGIFAGYLPALSASKLNPIDAIRYK